MLAADRDLGIKPRGLNLRSNSSCSIPSTDSAFCIWNRLTIRAANGALTVRNATSKILSVHHPEATHSWLR